MLVGGTRHLSAVLLLHDPQDNGKGVVVVCVADDLRARGGQVVELPAREEAAGAGEGQRLGLMAAPHLILCDFGICGERRELNHVVDACYLQRIVRDAVLAHGDEWMLRSGHRLI